MKQSILVLACQMMAAVSLAAGYPYPDFDTVEVSNAAQNRDDWRVNAVDWSGAEKLAEGLLYLPVKMTPDGGWPRRLYCHFARVDLNVPGLTLTGTERCEGWGETMIAGTDYERRTVVEKTGDFVARNRAPVESGGRGRDMRLAMNATSWTPFPSGAGNYWGNINGPFYADGLVISREWCGGPGDLGVFVLKKDGTASVLDYMYSDDAAETSFSVPAFGHRLIRQGTVVEGLPSSDPRPRSAIGVSADHRYVYLLVADGDSSGWSSGCEISVMARLMAAAGAYDAVNLDGGGSSNMVGWDFANSRPLMMGRTSGGFTAGGQRAVGANLGVYCAAVEAKLGTPRLSASASGSKMNISVAVEAVSQRAVDAGCRLVLTVVEDSGAATNVFEQAVGAAGDYGFAFRGDAIGYAYTLALVDREGTVLPGASEASGAFLLGKEKLWFAADAETGVATGGTWTVRTPETDVFEATDKGKVGRVLLCSETTVRDGYAVETAWPALLAAAEAAGAMPHTALMLLETANGGCAWGALVQEPSGPVLCRLRGSRAPQTERRYRTVQEVDFTSGLPRVRYFAGEGAVLELLHDDTGRTSFAGAGETDDVLGVVRRLGSGGELHGFEGFFVVRRGDGMLLLIVRN